MNTLLVILALLGISAVLLSAYVFTVAARTFVSDEHDEHSALHPLPAEATMFYGTSNRRSGKPVEFPLTVNGTVIAQDRRKRPERRLAYS